MAVMELLEQNFNEAINSSEWVVIDFFATWCGPCKMLSPVLDKVSENRSNIKFFKVNVDNANVVSQQFGIQSIPTVILFQNGKHATQFMGFQPQQKIEEWLNNYVK